MIFAVFSDFEFRQRLIFSTVETRLIENALEGSKITDVGRRIRQKGRGSRD